MLKTKDSVSTWRPLPSTHPIFSTLTIVPLIFTPLLIAVQWLVCATWPARLVCKVSKLDCRGRRSRSSDNIPLLIRRSYNRRLPRQVSVGKTRARRDEKLAKLSKTQRLTVVARRLLAEDDTGGLCACTTQRSLDVLTIP